MRLARYRTPVLAARFVRFLLHFFPPDEPLSKHCFSVRFEKCAEQQSFKMKNSVINTNNSTRDNVTIISTSHRITANERGLGGILYRIESFNYRVFFSDFGNFNLL